MLKPGFILFAQSSIEDKHSGLLSLFQIIERLNITPVPALDRPTFVLWPGLEIVATWYVEPGDNLDDEYEWEARLFLPGVAEPMVLGDGRLRFGQPDPSKLMTRNVIRFQTPPPIGHAGCLRAEAKMRRVGTEQWTIQENQVMVHLMGEIPQQSPPTDAPA